MKKSIILLIAFIFVIKISKAQNVMQISGLDCNGNSHDLFADLDAGKAVVVFFFMPNCGSCPPPAQKVQAMANQVMMTHPGMITGYAMPYNNTTDCANTSSWVTTSGVPFYAPYDSGAVQVANYGGFGMPTVVLLGGSASNRRVMFSTLSFAIGDTTIMRDSILALFNTSGINDLPTEINSVTVYPNPASENVSINLDLKEASNLLIDLVDLTGRQVAIILDAKQNGLVTKQFSTEALLNGNYIIRIQVNGKTTTQQLNVNH